MSRYHYAITLQSEVRNGVQVSWLAGVITPAPGQTRDDVFGEVFQAAADRAAASGGSNPVPLFFSLEPDELT